ncbi:hypothetical protein CYMTET_8670 [Cymbomonas tetramitiformis]|uniref:Uncharacterized protein n=1 Tax=Cymbomonas tetramitiformis TaxID=36881 RepID=A0AAE0LFS4_9CHLO|nr:hypothetical protein CYMTET_8670 [Cymbomonas tetramitiformis]|eukprot:gene2731-3505_t
MSTNGRKPRDLFPTTYPVSLVDAIPISDRCADPHADLMALLEEFCISRRSGDTEEASRRSGQIVRLIREYSAVRRGGEMLILETPALAACRALSFLFEPTTIVYSESRYRSLLAGASFSMENTRDINMVAITLVHDSHARCEAWMDVRVAENDYTLTGVVYRTAENHFFGDILRWNGTVERVRRAMRMFRSSRTDEGVEDVTRAYEDVRRLDGGNDVRHMLPSPRGAFCCLLLYCRRDSTFE